MIDHQVEIILFHKMVSKEEFMKQVNDENLYNALHNSKCGLIEIEHSFTGVKHSGFTAAFGEGIGCYMSNEDRWYTTSVIKKIDWENGSFETLNSTYKFEFEEMNWDELKKDLQVMYDNFIQEYEGKNKKIK